LVQNAMTHGGPGRIKVEAMLRDKWILIQVRDDGPGVPPKDRKRIFSRFERGADSTESKIPGLGLGLAQVKDFAKHHGGDVSLECPPDGGSVFTLRLPVTEVTP